jgi:hypothetical protein
MYLGLVTNPIEVKINLFTPDVIITTVVGIIVIFLTGLLASWCILSVSQSVLWPL